MSLLQHPLLETLAPLFDALARAGGRPLLVGGAVRDLLLGLPPTDIDVEVYGIDGQHLAAALAPFGRVDAVGRSFGVLKLRLDGYNVDVALPARYRPAAAGEPGALAEYDPSLTPREALARRDFTINALALTPSGDLVDYFGGRADLEARRLCHTSEAFGDDPLRVLRAMQFAARFNMRLAPDTAALCRTLLPASAGLPLDRIWREWHKWATLGAHPSAGLRALDESGWLALYPELAALQGCPQHPHFHPEGDVWLHTLYVCDAAVRIAERDALDARDRAVLIFAALCHDLGKPPTTIVEEDGIPRSPGHATAGVPLTRAFLARIGSPHWLEPLVTPLVREHLAHLHTPPTPRVVRRLAHRLTPATLVQWERLVEADASGRPPLPPERPAAAHLALAEAEGAAKNRPAPLVRGRDLIAAGVEPGPRLGALLRRAYEAQLDGAFRTVEEGIAWVLHTNEH
ncbi:CCA tRNA nucleotidyltransferase [Roseiflexus castenholzii]|uniref:Polynucleotide adenylyltransferase/metal dependent phosphohydrolase n=1 Tax=Roseiflexus castenholzii (strain DSM 13941 / HLO8) TaxID=383372 RepID=A7NRF4_ROSCS|nr:HD domain-containing protein [Roseiflexus castenholzii]ABU60150.1 polynucleotide adenylyltransferase/metal dependent phosphohydrolase [Roseiflexus castenholzii DSM 13941]